jgi:allantoinase
MRAFSSRRVLTLQGVRPAAILVADETIKDVVAPADVPAGVPLTNFGNAALLPGLVDSHTHVNEPGRTEWEGFATATRAAAAGGYTTIVDMPLNCLPPTTMVQALEEKRACAAKSSLIDFALWGGVVGDNQEHIERLAAAGVPGFKCFLVHPGIDGLTMVTEPQLRAALPHVAKTGLPLLVHAELPGPIERAERELAHADWRNYETYLRSRPDEAELAAIELLLSLCREFRFRLHIVHLASSQAIAMLRRAKAEGLPITVETCPHYLYFSAEHIADGATLCKCAPPIRRGANREQLWQALREGVIDLVATDHSPCPPSLKRLDEGIFRTAWGGISSLSVALPVMWTEAKHRNCSLGDIARWMSEKPAELAGCGTRKGKIAPGYDADFLVFEPEAEFVLTEDRLHQRHRVSPYLGHRLTGLVRQTFVRGNCVFSAGEFLGSPAGRELTRSPRDSRHS